MSSDTVDVDELGRRAAAAVRDRAGYVAGRSGHEAPPPVRRPRPVAKRVLAVAAAVAVAGGVVGFASAILAGRPPGLSVQPLASPSGEVAHPALQRQWVEQICVPATVAVDDCWDHVRSEMWPWHSDEPLEALEAQYSQPGWCDRFGFSADGYDQCRKLSHFYRTGGPPRSAILDELDAADEVLDVSIWGDENPSGATIRVACEHLTQARDLATDPGTPLDAHLRNRIRNLRAYTCEDPDPSATEIHDQLKQLLSDVADQVD